MATSTEINQALKLIDQSSRGHNPGHKRGFNFTNAERMLALRAALTKECCRDCTGLVIDQRGNPISLVCLHGYQPDEIHSQTWKDLHNIPLGEEVSCLGFTP